MIEFIFTKKSEKHFLNLPESVQLRIKKKLTVLKEHGEIFSALKRLHDFEPATHRLRIGSYRLILELRSQTKDEIVFWILDVGDRKSIYK